MTVKEIRLPTQIESFPILITMAEQPVSVPKHPVAPRMTNGPKKPHIGPHIQAYHEAHAQTVGPQSDAWWAKVSAELLCAISS
jgi:hypothetical protein